MKVMLTIVILHLLENGKNDDLIYRDIDIHSNVVKYDDTKKDDFLTKNGDTMRVVCNVFSTIPTPIRPSLDYNLNA